ncbi:DUF5133 domain-containing protein [Streptomyces sp. NPDC052013]|uniref:DUF5133 domain-containing protein n=1 Tax=Streptomyces sp. NPDC052013 TaxID=3365679 RepID=UPI0037D09AAD
MLKPHPSVLRRLVDEYESLLASGAPHAPHAPQVASQAPHAPVAPSARIRDLAYTLCVSTGTRDVRQALETAHRWLAGAAPPGPVTR